MFLSGSFSIGSKLKENMKYLPANRFFMLFPVLVFSEGYVVSLSLLA